MKIRCSSITFKILIGGCLAVTLPLIVVGILTVNKATDALFTINRQGLATSAYQVADALDSHLKMEKKATYALSGSTSIQMGVAMVFKTDIKSARFALKKVDQTFDKNIKDAAIDNVFGFFITDKNGAIITGKKVDGGSFNNISLGNQHFFTEAQKSTQVTVSSVMRLDSNELVYVICAPIFDKKDIFMGSLGLAIKSEALAQELGKIKMEGGGYAFLTTKEGIVLSHPQKTLILNTDISTIKGMTGISNAIAQAEHGAMGYVYKDIKNFAGYAPVKASGWSVVVTQEEKAFLQGATEIRNIILITILISLFVAIVLLFFGSRQLVKPMHSVTAGLKDIAEGEGDLTARLTITTKDEVGDIAEWFNVFVEKLQKVVTQISNNSSPVGDNSKKLVKIAFGLLEKSEETAKRAKTVSNATTDLQSRLENMAEIMSHSALNVSTVASASEEMVTTISEIAQGAESTSQISTNAVSQSRNASQKMDELTEAAVKIGRVTETITEISEQTNLLALNATIEAARAGDAGKGFVVVANEIKELAKQTAVATADIKTVINKVQETTQAAEGELSEISKVIIEVNEAISSIAVTVEQQAETTKEITENIVQASSGLQDVHENVEQCLSVAKDINNEIADVSTSSQEIMLSGREVQENAEELSALSQELDATVQHFKVE